MKANVLSIGDKVRFRNNGGWASPVVDVLDIQRDADGVAIVELLEPAVEEPSSAEAETESPAPEQLQAPMIGEPEKLEPRE